MLFYGVLTYLFGINVLGLILMHVDKKRAQTGRWRIRESSLFLVGGLGGSLGSILGMQLFRHKTKHLSFTIGMPVILVLQLCLLWFIQYRIFRF